MKISYRTHPVLEKLHTGRLGTIEAFGCDRAQLMYGGLKKLDDFWQGVSQEIGNNIYYLAKPFLDAYEKAADKIFESNILKDVEDQNICFIQPSGETTCLKITNDVSASQIRCESFGFLNNTPISATVNTYTYTDDCTKPVRTFNGWVSNNIKGAEQNTFNCILLTLFIKYAEVETKLLPAGQKTKGIDCKYVNDTKSNVTVLDSSWFTNYIKSDSFKVRSHLRLQPYKKDGVWTKKFIWIKEFEKHGYTRKAGILQ